MRAEGRNGDCWQDGQVIRLADDLSPQNGAEVFLHEILHPVVDAMLPEIESEPHELIVTQVAKGLCCVMRDNPKAIMWMLENLTGEST